MLVIGLGISLIDAPFLRDQLFQHSPMPIAIAFLVVAAARGWFSFVAMSCMAGFLALHVIGARYVYSFVPFGESLSVLSLGGDVAERNHYDRLVHLLFGFLAMIPLVEAMDRFTTVTRGVACAAALMTVIGLGALYEVFEWLLTILVSPQDAERYNGQQGDPWDAQKDMALAALGAAFALWPAAARPTVRLVR